MSCGACGNNLAADGGEEAHPKVGLEVERKH